MEDGDSMKEHINAFLTLVSQLISIYIKMGEEYKCFTLLCSLLDSLDNLLVATCNTIQSTLKFEDVVASLLSEEMRRKSMEYHNIDALLVRLGCTKERV